MGIRSTIRIFNLSILTIMCAM